MQNRRATLAVVIAASTIAIATWFAGVVPASAAAHAAVAPSACAALTTAEVGAVFGQPVEGLDESPVSAEGESLCALNIGAKHCPDEGVLRVLYTDRSKESSPPDSLKAQRKAVKKGGDVTTVVKAKGIGKGAFIVGGYGAYQTSIVAQTKAASVTLILGTQCVPAGFTWLDPAELNAKLTKLAQDTLAPA